MDDDQERQADRDRDDEDRDRRPDEVPDDEVHEEMVSDGGGQPA